MFGDRAPATGVGRFQAPTGPGGVGPRGAGDTRRGAGGSIRMMQADTPRPGRLLTYYWRTGRTDDGSARAEARMPAVGGCMGSEHGRRAPRSRSHHSARFESRAGRPSRNAASPPAATAGHPARRRPHTGRPQFEPAQPAGRAAGRVGRAAGRVGRAAPTWRPAGFGPRPAGWPARFVRRPGRIWASASRVAGRIFRAAQPDLGGRPAGFGGSASRFWGVGWPGRPGGQPLTTYGSTTTYRAPVPI